MESYFRFVSDSECVNGVRGQANPDLRYRHFASNRQLQRHKFGSNSPLGGIQSTKGVSSITENYVLGVEIDQPETASTPTSNSDGTSTVTFTPSFGAVQFNQSFRAKIAYTL